jgi:hypothetical protein
MPSIGSVTCTFVRGHIPQMAQLSEQWHVPGVDGDGLALLGLTCEPFRLTAVIYSSQSGLTELLYTLIGLQGQIVGITNDVGQEISAYLKQVGPPKRETACIPGSAITQKATVEVTCVPIQ